MRSMSFTMVTDLMTGVAGGSGVAASIPVDFFNDEDLRRLKEEGPSDASFHVIVSSESGSSNLIWLICSAVKT
jgi:hypothetical protein